MGYCGSVGETYALLGPVQVSAGPGIGDKSHSMFSATHSLAFSRDCLSESNSSACKF